MFTTKQYRAKSDEYTELLKTASGSNETKEFRTLEQDFGVMADDAQWLADQDDRTVPATKRGPAIQMDLTEEEEGILRCLGAALIMQWGTLPRKLQRELFDNAGCVGELLISAPPRGQIARFLHKHNGSRDQVQRTRAVNNANRKAADVVRWDNEGGASHRAPS